MLLIVFTWELALDYQFFTCSFKYIWSIIPYNIQCSMLLMFTAILNLTQFIEFSEGDVIETLELISLW